MNNIVTNIITDPLLRNLVIGSVAVLIFIFANRIFNKSEERFQD